MRDGSNQLAIPTPAKSGPEYFMNRAYGDKQRQYFSRAFLTWRSIKAHDRTILSCVGFMFFDVHKYVRKGAKQKHNIAREDVKTVGTRAAS
ncbi:hypothetical protein F2Q68_00041784 [Brassica cretica]|uniref:Uncharacterized protein n=1 Tax=Brassica cretica TaxID=69181 RepID=A0A8S9ML46_BRACR|nr:hypothetical protein F2Q68_00041784 [Brassica cretica]